MPRRRHRRSQCARSSPHVPRRGLSLRQHSKGPSWVLGPWGQQEPPGEGRGEPQALPFLPYTTPHPSPTTMPPPAPSARGSQSPCGDPALLPPQPCSPQLSPQPITLPRRPLLHLHPARTVSDTARNTEVTEKREEEPESQNQMKRIKELQMKT